MTCIDCGCDLTGSRLGRLRCSSCRQKHLNSYKSRIRKENPGCRREADNAYNKTRRKIRNLGYNCRKSVMVVDVHVADPWFISKNELALYAKEYANTPGITVFVDGKQAAIQEVLF